MYIANPLLPHQPSDVVVLPQTDGTRIIRQSLAHKVELTQLKKQPNWITSGHLAPQTTKQSADTARASAVAAYTWPPVVAD